jgi:hypothetical protein
VLTADAASDLRRFARARGQSVERLDAAQAVTLMWEWYDTRRVDDVSLDADGDTLLFQWGTYSWNDGKFSYNVTRQFIIEVDNEDDHDEAIWQLALTVLYDSADAAVLESGNWWCGLPEDLDEFRSFVESCPATAFALVHRPVASGITFGPAG